MEKNRLSNPCRALAWCLLIGLSCVPATGLAYDMSDKFSGIIEGLINLTTQGWARILAVMAVVGIGYGTVALGKIPRGIAIATFIGFGIIFSAGYVASELKIG